VAVKKERWSKGRAYVDGAVFDVDIVRCGAGCIAAEDGTGVIVPDSYAIGFVAIFEGDNYVIPDARTDSAAMIFPLIQTAATIADSDTEARVTAVIV
jgi:hypothetical protein